MSAPPPPSPGRLPLTSPRPLDQKPSTANRRLFERHLVDCSCRVTELDEFGHPGGTWTCRLADLSRSGAGLRSRRMVHQGRHVFIELESASGAPKLLFGVVRQARYAEGEGYAIGIEFRAVPPNSAIRNWLAQRGLHL